MQATDQTGEDTGSSLSPTREQVRSDAELRVAEILDDLGATESDAGTVVTIPDTVLFAFDSADLLPQAASTLDAIVEVLVFHAGVPAQVRGHTDNVGGTTYNDRLSQARAEAVADYLTSVGGIDSARLTVVGVGDREPVAPNTHPDGADNPDGRARNRRVEVVLPTVTSND